MAPSILILSHPEDIHAHAVARALERKGAEASVWYTSDYPMKSCETFRAGNAGVHFALDGTAGKAEFEQVRVVWNRRPTYLLDDQLLHPADRDYAQICCRQFRMTLIDALAPGAFWINPPNSEQRCSKMRQQIVAQETGIRIPETIYSNDPAEIARFIRSHGGAVVYKSIVASRPWQGDDRCWQLFTSIVTEDNLVDGEILRLTPGIYQEVVPKEFELRINIVGNRCFAARVESQKTTTGKLDWRRSYHEVEMTPFGLPAKIEAQCRAMLARFNLVFGTFDLIVTPEGEFVFLEINQMGQFLFVERYTKQPLLNALCEMMIQGSEEYDDSSPMVSYGEILGESEEAVKVSSASHVVIPNLIWDERAGVLES